jgi:hypothetical protein
MKEPEVICLFRKVRTGGYYICMKTGHLTSSFFFCPTLETVVVKSLGNCPDTR